MNEKEFDILAEINSRLKSIENLFYKNFCTAGGHYELGKLMEYVQNIYENIEEVDM